MEFRQLQRFVRVVELGTLSAAAEDLNLTVQAVSKSINKLEANLGYRLIDRTHKGVEATHFGEVLLRHAKRILADVRGATEELQAIDGLETGHVTVGAGVTVLNGLLPRATELLLCNRPNLTVSVRRGLNTALIPSLAAGDLDFVLTGTPELIEVPGLTVEALFKMRDVVVARSGHPLAGLTKVSLRQLLEFRWIFAPNSMLHQKLQRAAKHAKLPDPVMVVDSDSIQFRKSAVEGTDLLTILPPRFVEREVQTDSLAILPFAEVDWMTPVCLIYRDPGRLSPATRSLMDEVRANSVHFDDAVGSRAGGDPIS